MCSQQQMEGLSSFFVKYLSSVSDRFDRWNPGLPDVPQSVTREISKAKLVHIHHGRGEHRGKRSFRQSDRNHQVHQKHFGQSQMSNISCLGASRNSSSQSSVWGTVASAFVSFIRLKLFLLKIYRSLVTISVTIYSNDLIGMVLVP